MADKCMNIGSVADLPKNAAVRKLAAKAGDPEQLDSCDIAAQYGAVLLDVAAISSFMLNEEQAITIDGATRTQKLLSRYPTAHSLEKPLKDALMKHVGHSIGAAFEASANLLYGKIAAAHKASKVGYHPTEYKLLDPLFQLFQRLCRNAADDQDLINHYTHFICGNSQLPPDLVAQLVTEVTQRTARGKSAEIMEQTAPFPACLQAARANPAKTALIHKAIRDGVAIAAKESATIAVPELKKLFQQHRATIVIAWATWCHYCKDALPALQAKLAQLEEQDIGVVGVIAAKDGTEEEIQAVLGKYQISFPSVTSDYAGRFSGYPTLLLVDRAGNVLTEFDGWNSTALPSLLSKIPEEAKPEVEIPEE